MQGVCHHSLFDALHDAGHVSTQSVCLCRLQQVRSLWSEIPHIQKAVEKLSKECMDLLNRIFVVDDKKRITIEAIKEHPWSALPPPPPTPSSSFSFVCCYTHTSVHLAPCLSLSGVVQSRTATSVVFHLALRIVLAGLVRSVQLKLLLKLYATNKSQVKQIVHVTNCLWPHALPS